MDTNALKKFAQSARNLLIAQVTARLDMVLAEGAAARREHPAAIARLEAAANSNRGQVIEQAAYTWFNRFTALRFMDVTGLTNPRVVTPADGATRPELLAEAMAANLPDGARNEIAEYLNGTRPAHDGQAEAYRLLLIHACNEWHHAMPYMFERADMLDRAEDYTELLMPDDLLSPDSILARLREVMTEDACKDVEIIGWLYQFYISEKKDQVFAGLKKNQKITAENIPAATQLFTPHWIVRYLVENSLGRLWLLNRPSSGLGAKMDYYIAPEEPETDFLRIQRAEDIRICDPACGSGHMLTYAFDLLHEIYAEEGHDAAEIPGLILQHNLTGIEIDDRAGALAAFALSMKAAAKLGRRRFLRMEAKPDIVVLQNVSFTPTEIQDVAAVVGNELFTDELRETLGKFEQAKNFGSLIVTKLCDPVETLRIVEARYFGTDLLLKELQERVMAVLRMAEALSPKYHVVVANPPYAGSGGLNAAFQKFAKLHYPQSQSDLYSMFIDRCLSIALAHGLVSMVTIQNWLFLSSFEKLRNMIVDRCSIRALVQIGYNSFPELNSKVVQAAAFTLENAAINRVGSVMNLNDTPQSANKPIIFSQKRADKNYTTQSLDRFSHIPGNVFAFWLPEPALRAFDKFPALSTVVALRKGLTTMDNGRFLRSWQECNISNVSFNAISAEDASQSKARWFPVNKGGGYRKWFGLNDLVIDWGNNGKELKDHIVKVYNGGSFTKEIRSEEHYFKPNITWTTLTSSAMSMRYSPPGFIFESKGSVAVSENRTNLEISLAFCNSAVANFMLGSISPSLDFNAGPVGSCPIPIDLVPEASSFATRCIAIARSDWDAQETSWGFATLPMLSIEHRGENLASTYANMRAHWQKMTNELQNIEEENNRIFIDAYGLQNYLLPRVGEEEVTLSCNPAYRYGVKSSKEERETRLREETVAEFLHYAVGCMFGRYSLDATGLILANQGEGIEDYLARVPEPSFAPDRDNVIPVLDTDWFPDDIVTRARDFLRITFGEAKFRENLAFVEAALGKDLRKWFTKDFFDYHVRRYKKRPIYWMFSSPRGSFNALIYMHRYRPDTVSVVLNQYVREFIHKLEVERARLEKLALDPAATPAQQTKAQKETAAVIKQIAELTEWERDVVYPMAQQKIAIDLNDGVKRNYPLFAGALKPIKGLEAADD